MPTDYTGLTLEQVRKELCEAMQLPQSIDWLEEACRQLEAHRARSGFTKVYDVTTVGKRIRTAREVVGLTSHQLSDRLKLDHRHVYDIEQGKRPLRADLVPWLSRLLKVREAWLLMETDEGGPPLPVGVLRRQTRVNWHKATMDERKKANARAELERLRGLRPPKPKRATSGDK